jgi:membrane glycosyltransferase
MRVTRIVSVLGVLIYIGLWILEVNGANALLAPLVIPLVLAVMVAGGVALDRFIGITPRRQEFAEPDEDDDQS